MALHRPLLALALLAAGACAHGEGLAVRGHVGAEFLQMPRYQGQAPDPDTNPVQSGQAAAFRAQLELTHSPSDRVSLAARGFLRRDLHNDGRNAARFDELWVQVAAPGWDLRLGNQIVTWGSVESVSPLDVVNPRDYEEDLVEPRKIGSLAARFRKRFAQGDWSLYWLPRYEASLFASPKSYYSFSGGLPVSYPGRRWSGRQWATRLFHSGDGFDVGLSYFSGLERNAVFEFGRLPGGAEGLVGHTYSTRRLGLDVTGTVGEVVLKGELVARTSHEPGNRRALLYVLGAEKTWSSVVGYSDLTLFAEHLGSSRNVRERELMQNDLFVALRWTFNDPLRQRLQAGTFQDLDHGGRYVWRIEYSASPLDHLDVMLRYTQTRRYYPGPDHTEADTGVLHLMLKHNF